MLIVSPLFALPALLFPPPPLAGQASRLAPRRRRVYLVFKKLRISYPSGQYSCVFLAKSALTSCVFR
jgi:hypothetical protein